MFTNEEILQKLAVSAAWLIAILVVRFVSLRFVRNQRWSKDEVRMRWHLHIGQGTLLLLLIGLLLLWGSELQAMALSAVAIAAAIVIAFKELIMCVSGSIFRAASDCFTIGDRVEIDDLRGEVISYGILTTTMLEIGPDHLRTGRAVSLPNSLLLSNSLLNETFTEKYVLHSFSVCLNQGDDWKSAEQALLQAAEEVCGGYRQQARQHMDSITQLHGLPDISVDPRVTLMVPEPGKLYLHLRVPTPAHRKGSTEQRILRRFMEQFQVGRAADAG